MAAKTMWRVRLQTIIEVEVEGEYAYDARKAAAPLLTRYFEGGAVESLSVLSAERFERTPLKNVWSDDGTEKAEEQVSATGAIQSTEQEGAQDGREEGAQGQEGQTEQP